MFRLISACVKAILRTLSNKKFRRDEKAAHQIARIRTGRKIAYGKRKGVWVDGKALYKKEYDAQISYAQDRKQVREKLIDSLP